MLKTIIYFFKIFLHKTIFLLMCCRWIIVPMARRDYYSLFCVTPPTQALVLYFAPSFPIPLHHHHRSPSFVAPLWISHTKKLGLISILQDLFSVVLSEQVPRCHLKRKYWLAEGPILSVRHLP